jgi:EAL domain-containing protein (putative c-di-GMP-specific phosphodiesterase class I)/CheY-like chemotaxis protein
MKVFIVEDDTFQLALLKKGSKNIKQAEVSLFTNISDCMCEISITNEPFVLVSDINMPEETGVSLITKLKSYPNVQGLLIVSGVERDILDTLCTMASIIGIPLIRSIQKPTVLTLFRKNLIEMMLLIHERLNDKKSNAKRDFSLNELLLYFLEGNYQPYFQPQMCSKSLKMIGVEMLSRLHLDGKIYTPDYFIDKLIKGNQITFYTLHLLEKSIRLLKAYNLHHIPLSFNVDYTSLQESGFCFKIKAIIDKYDFAPEKLVVEITENESDITVTLMSNLAELRIMGINLSADDFGMGKSGLNELLNLPFNELKIDQSLVKDFDNNPKSLNILRSIISLGQSLDIKIVAEGVETQSQLAELTRLGVDKLQGYLFSKPVPIYELENNIKLITSSCYAQNGTSS